MICDLPSLSACQTQKEGTLQVLQVFW